MKQAQFRHRARRVATAVLLAVAGGIATSETGGPRTFVVTSNAVTAATRVAGEAGDHSFMYVNSDGLPARFDPCQVLHYRVNAAGAPTTGGQDVAEALRRITAATGLRFVRDGRTPILPGNGRFDGWGDIDLVIAWATPAQRASLAGRVVGEGGVQLAGRGPFHISKAYVLLDAVDLGRYRAGWGLGGVGTVYAHEVGHAVGLGHASSPPEVMYGEASSTSTATFQRGDLAGLRMLGKAQGCL